MDMPKKMMNPYQEDESPLILALKNPTELPALPTIIHEIIELVNNPDSSGAQLRDVIERDPVITTAILKLINSAYYAIPGGVSNLQHAIAYLGYDAIYQVAIAVSIIKTYAVTNFSKFKLSDFWVHSFCVATWSEELAKATKHSKPQDCFTGGLLHDFGKLFIFKEDPEVAAKIVTRWEITKKYFSMFTVAS